MLKMDAWVACAKALWLKQHQFIQHLFIAVGDTVVTTVHGQVWQVQRGSTDAEAQGAYQLCGQQTRPVSVLRAIGSLQRVFSRGW